MSEAIVTATPPKEPKIGIRTKKMVLYFAMFSIVMMFAGLSSAYVVSSYGALWVHVTLPTAFYLSTALILLSSLTLHLAVRASRGGNHKKSKNLLIFTIVLGVGFGVSQVVGWNQLVQVGSFVSGYVDNLDGVYGKDYTISYRGEELVYADGNYYYPNDELREKPLRDEIAVHNNQASSYVYLLSFVHLLHILGGLLFLLGILLFGIIARRGVVDTTRLRLGAIYWHFVDGLWIYLLLFLLIIH